MPHGILIISQMPHNFIYNIPDATHFYIISRMPHYYIHNISHATPLLGAIQRYLSGSFCALLGRGSNIGDAFRSLHALFGFGRNCNGDACTGDGGAGDPCTGDASAGDPRTDGGNAGTGDPRTGGVDAGAGDPRTGGYALTSSSESDNSSPAATLAASIAFAFAFAFALACSTKGAKTLSNSESEDSSRIDLSELESLEISLQSRNLLALPFRASCATQRLLLWPNCKQFVHFVYFLFNAPFRIRFTLRRPLFFAISRGNILG